MFSDSLKPSSKISDKSFNRNSWSKITSPIRILIVSIWEEIILFFWVLLVFTLDRFNICTWSWIKEFYAKFRPWVYKVNKLINTSIPHSSICIMEIFSHRVHQSLCAIMQRHWFKVIDKSCWFFHNIVALKSLIISNWIWLITYNVKAKSRGRRIMIIVYMGKYVVWTVRYCLLWIPNHL